VPRTPGQHPEKRLLIERIAVGAGCGELCAQPGTLAGSPVLRRTRHRVSRSEESIRNNIWPFAAQLIRPDAISASRMGNAARRPRVGGLGLPSRRDARHLLQADSTQSAHARLDLSLLRLARAQLDEDPSVPGVRELVRRRGGRRQVLVDRVAGVGVLHRVRRDFGRPVV